MQNEELYKLYTANHPLIWIFNKLIHADASVAIASNIDFCCSTNTHAVQVQQLYSHYVLG